MSRVDDVLERRRKQQADGTYQSTAGQTVYNNTLKDMQPSQEGWNAYQNSYTNRISEMIKPENRQKYLSAAEQAYNDVQYQRNLLRIAQGLEPSSYARKPGDVSIADQARWARNIDKYGAQAEESSYNDVEYMRNVLRMSQGLEPSRNLTAEKEGTQTLAQLRRAAEERQRNDEIRHKYAGMSIEDVEAEREEKNPAWKFDGINRLFASIGRFANAGTAAAGGITTTPDVESEPWDVLYYEYDKDGNTTPVTYESLISRKHLENVQGLLGQSAQGQQTSADIDAYVAFDRAWTRYEMARNDNQSGTQYDWEAMESEVKDLSRKAFGKEVKTFSEGTEDEVWDNKNALEDEALSKISNSFKGLGITNVSAENMVDYVNAMADKAESEKLSAQRQGQWLGAGARFLMAAPMQAGEYVGNLIDASKKNPLLPGGNIYNDYFTQLAEDSMQAGSGAAASVGQWIGGDVLGSEKLGNVMGLLASAAYSGVLSGIQSTATMGVLAALLPETLPFAAETTVGQAIGQVMLAMQSAGSTYRQAIQNGKTVQGATISSFTAGINEALFEGLSFGNLPRLKRWLESGGNLGKQLAVYGIQTAIEGSEEVFTDIGNFIADEIANADLSDYNQSVQKYIALGYTREQAEATANKDFLLQLVESGLGGMFGGATNATGVVAIANEARKTANRNNLVRAVANAVVRGDNVNRWVEDAEALPDIEQNAQIKQLAEQVKGLDLSTKSGQRQAAKLIRQGYKTIDSAANEEYYKANPEAKAAEDARLENRAAAEYAEKQGYKVTSGTDGADVVSIDSVVKKGDDIVATYKLADGTKVTSDNIKFNSSEDAILWSEAAKITGNAEQANAIVQSYAAMKGEVSPVAYIRAAQEAYRYGYAGYTLDEAKASGSFFSQLTKNVGEELMSLGQRQAQALREKQGRVVPVAAGVKFVNSQGQEVDYAPAGLSRRQQATVEYMQAFSEKFGGQYVFFASQTKKGTARYATDVGTEKAGSVAQNAFYDPKTGKIYVDLNAGGASVQTSLWSVAHEMTHKLKTSSPAQYMKLFDAVMSAYRTVNGADANRLADRISQAYKAAGYSLTEEDALEEVLCQAMADMLLSEHVNEMFDEISKSDKKLGEQVKQFFRDMLAKIKKFFNGYSGSTEESRLLRQAALEDIRKIEDLWTYGVATMNEGAETATEGSVDEMYDGGDGNTRQSIKSLTAAMGLWAEKDSDGIIRFYMEGKQINKVTAKHIRENSGIGLLITNAKERGFIKASDANEQYKAAADLMNMIMQTNDPEATWAFAGSALFSAVKANSDPQYSTTIDFTTVCRKTQEMVTAMSAAMKEKGRGLTKDEVKELQREVFRSGGEVPCPVCYVFSRWAGIGGVLDKIARMQKKYARLTKAEVAEQVSQMEAEMNEKGIKSAKARNKLKEELDSEITELNAELETLQTEGKDKARQKEIQTRLDEIVPKAELLDEWTWAKDVIPKTDYKAVPDEILFDLDRGADFAADYPVVWKYRNSRGPSAGKAILPYSDMRFGDLMMSVNTANTIKTDAKTGEHYRSEAFTDRNGEVDALGNAPGGFKKKSQYNAYGNAVARMAAQNLIGGQRLQSTSDFRYEYVLDYMQAFWELQALGAKVQTYTKVVEYADLIASLGGDVNLSVMPKDKGYEAGVLKFSSVTGINFEAAKEASAKYPNAQLILVGINDEHIRLALDDENGTGGEYIGFVIPYHTSGASIEEYISALVRNLDEDFNRQYYVDYTPYQGDVVKKKNTDAQKTARELRKKLLTKKGGLTAEEKRMLRGTSKDITGKTFEELRAVEEAALKGDEAAMEEYLSWSAGVLPELHRKMTSGAEKNTKLTAAQAQAVMPHEYWNKDTTRKNAYVNGFIFRSYCERLGLHPRFTGWTNKAQEGEHGDFSGNKGYWKTLIDRPMYDNDGNYRDQQRINLSGFDKDMLTPEYAQKTYPAYKIQEPNARRAEAVGKAYARGEKSGYVRGGKYDVPSTVKRQLREETRMVGKDGKTYVAMHKLSLKALKKWIQHDFTLINPSVGVSDVDNPYESFGDVAIVFDKGRFNFDSPDSPVYNGDAYSFSHQPSAFFIDYYDLSDHLEQYVEDGSLSAEEQWDIIKALEDLPVSEMNSPSRYSSDFEQAAIIRGDTRDWKKKLYDENSEAFDKLYHLEKGEDAETTYRQHIKNEYWDTYETRLTDDFASWLEEFVDKFYTQEKVFKSVPDAYAYNNRANFINAYDYEAISEDMHEDTEQLDTYAKNLGGSERMSSEQLTSEETRNNLAQRKGAAYGGYYEVAVQTPVYDGYSFVLAPDTIDEDDKSSIELSAGIPVFTYEKNGLDWKQSEESYKQAMRDLLGGDEGEGTRFQLRDTTTEGRELAPVFYSQLERAIKNMKMDKIGASSVISFLKGRGVKDEEIKWSGIVPFLQGKKSVTKAELQRVMDENRIQIETVVKDREYDSNNYNDYLNAENEALELARQKIIDEGLDIDPDALSVDYNGDGDFDVTSTETGEVVYTYEAETKATNWSQYKLRGGENYREYVYRMPDSDYSNAAMKTHWKGIKGVVAHARAQDLYTLDGDNMLFIEEIQSDWHNAGARKGSTGFNKGPEYTVRRENNDWGNPIWRLYKNGEATRQFLYVDDDTLRAEKLDAAGIPWGEGTEYDDLLPTTDEEALKQLTGDIGDESIPDAPYAGEADSYIPFVLKNLIREAAEKGYDRIGWTTAAQQSSRWEGAGENADESYRIEYDQEIPKFLKKYGKQWGATVEDVAIDAETSGLDSETEERLNDLLNDTTERYLDVYDFIEEHQDDELTTNEDVDAYGSELEDLYSSAGKALMDFTEAVSEEAGQRNFVDWEYADQSFRNIIDESHHRFVLEGDIIDWGAQVIEDLVNSVGRQTSNVVHSMTIPDAMKESVLYEGQARFQLREPMEDYRTEIAADFRGKSLSETGKLLRDSREMLGEALDTVTVNGKEEKIIRDYVREIDAINEAERKLADINARLDELKTQQTEAMKEQGRRYASNEEIRQLEAQAKELADQITEHDRAILRMEATKTVKGLVRTYQNRVREARDKAILKQKMFATLTDLRKKLTDTSSEAYVPENLVEAAMAVLEVVDPGYKQGSKVREKYENMQGALMALRNAYDALRNDPDYNFSSEYDEDVDYALQELIQLVKGKTIKTMSYSELESAYHIVYDINQMIRWAAKSLTDAENRTNAELGNKLIAEQREYAEKGLVRRTKKGKLTPLGKFTEIERNWTLNPVRAMHEMGAYQPDSEMYKLADKMEEGLTKGAFWKMNALKPFEQLRRSKANRKLFNDAVQKTKDFGLTDVDGKRIDITPMQAMQMVLTWEREEANPITRHLESRIVIPDPKLMARGKYKEAAAAGRKMNPISQEVYASLMEQLTGDKAENREWNTKFLDAAKRFFRTETTKAINETTMQVKHRPVATTLNYIPFEVYEYDIASKESNIKFDGTVSGSGSMKSVRPGANSMLVMRGLNGMITNSADEVSRIYGLLALERDIGKLLNYKQGAWVENPTSVRDAVNTVWGKKGIDLVERAFSDVRSPRPTNRSAIMEAVRNAFIVSTLAGNIGVTIKQAASYPTAGSVINPRALAKGMARYVAKASNPRARVQDVYDAIDKVTPLHWERRQGMQGIQELGDFAQSNGVLNRIDQTLGKASPMQWIQAVDVATTAALYYAAEEQAKLNGYKPGTEDFSEETKRVYEQALRETQPMYDPLHRAEITKTDDLRRIIMFQTQPLQNAGILYEAFNELRAQRKLHGAKSEEAKQATVKFMAAVGSQVASYAVFVLMTALGNALKHRMGGWRKDEDEEKPWGKIFIERSGYEMLKQIITNVFPVIGSMSADVIETIMKWNGRDDLEVLEDNVIGKINDTVQNLAEAWKNPSLATIRSALIDIGTYLGVPSENVYKLITGIEAHIQDMANGRLFNYEALSQNPQGLLEPWLEEKFADAKVRAIYDAIESGDPKKIKKVREDYKNSDGFTTAVAEALVEHDVRIEKAAAAKVNEDAQSFKDIVEEIVGEGSFTQTEVEKAVKLIEKRYNELAAGAAASLALKDTLGHDSAYAEMQDMGLDDEHVDELIDKAKKQLREDTLEDLAQQAADAMLVNDRKAETEARNELKEAGYTDEEISDAIEAAKRNPGEFDAAALLNNDEQTVVLSNAYISGDRDTIEEAEAMWTSESSLKTARTSAMKLAYLSGNVSKDQAMKMLTTYADKDEKDAWSKVMEWDYVAENGSSAGFTIMRRFTDAAQTKANYNAIAKEYLQYYEKGDLAKALASIYKPIYIESDYYGKEALLNEIIPLYVTIGYTAEYERRYIVKNWK